MRPSILLVGNDPLLLQTYIDSLRGKGQVATVKSRDAADISQCVRPLLTS